MNPISPNELATNCSFAKKLGIVFTELTISLTEATLGVDGNQQPFGLLHGGASAALCEHVASSAALVYARTTFGAQAAAAGTELSISHLRAIKGNTVTAKCKPLSLGRSSTVHQVEVFDEDGNLCGSARVTNVIIHKGKEQI